MNAVETIKNDFLLGTFITIRAYGENSDKAVSESIEKIKKIENLMSAFKENSDVNKININSGIKFTKISNETLFVIKKSIKYSNLSNGGFDITMKPIIDVWRNVKNTKKIPNKYILDEKLKLVDYKNIRFIFTFLKLKDKGQKIDLGGIAKGYAADEVLKILKKYKIKSAIIDLGGNIITLGKNLKAMEWKIGIQNPFEKRGNIVGYIESKDESIVTSGDYERFIMINNKKYHHFLDSKTGYPLDNGLISVTIISRESIDGDGLTSCCFSLGLEKSIDLIISLENIYGILIDKERNIYISSELKNRFTKTEKDFKLQIYGQ